jgi:hypothetical protein
LPNLRSCVCVDVVLCVCARPSERANSVGVCVFTGGCVESQEGSIGAQERAEETKRKTRESNAVACLAPLAPTTMCVAGGGRAVLVVVVVEEVDGRDSLSLSSFHGSWFTFGIERWRRCASFFGFHLRYTALEGARTSLAGGWKRGCVVCFPRRPRTRHMCVCRRALSESGNSSARRERGSVEVGVASHQRGKEHTRTLPPLAGRPRQASKSGGCSVCVCAPPVGETWLTARALSHREEENALGACVCDSLPLHVFRRRGPRPASQCVCVCVFSSAWPFDVGCVCVCSPYFSPCSRQTSLLSSPKARRDVSPLPSPRVPTNVCVCVCVLTAEVALARREMQEKATPASVAGAIFRLLPPLHFTCQ